MAYARQSLVLLFAERLMWKALTLQPAKLRSSRVYGLWLGRSQTSNAHLLGTRLGIVVARTIRRLPTAEREESSVSGGHDCAHRDEGRSGTNRSCRGSCNLWRSIASGQRRSLQFQFQILPSRRSRGHSHHRLQWKAANIQWRQRLFFWF